MKNDTATAQLFNALFIEDEHQAVIAAKAAITAGADVNAHSHLMKDTTKLSHDDSGKTPLHFAASARREGSDNTALVALLIEAGADVKGKDSFDLTPLHEAVLSRNAEAGKLLIKAGAVVDAKNRDGNTPLHHAAAITPIPHASSTFGDDKRENLKLLLAAGADPKVTNKAGKTPLAIAVDFENADGVRVLTDAMKNGNNKKAVSAGIPNAAPSIKVDRGFDVPNGTDVSPAAGGGGKRKGPSQVGG